MVEWKKLGEVCEVLDSQRKPVSKGKRRAGIYPYYGANGIQDYVDDFIFDGTFLLLGEDGSVINEDKSPILHWAIGKIWVNNHAHILKENSNASLRYLYYILQCTDVSDIVRGMPPKINQANMCNILLPIPSLAEQQRIVGILDTFTSAIDNLKAQIAQRRKQYEYYRDQLLDLEGKEGVEMKTLLDVLEQPITDGPHETPVFYDEGVPFISADAIVNNQIDFNRKRGCISDEYDKLCRKKYAPRLFDIYLVKSGSTTGKVAIVKTEDRFNIWSPLAAIRVDKDNNPLFIYYMLQTKQVQEQVRLKSSQGSQPNLSMRVLEKFVIRVPSLSEQSRIVSILDTFESSIQNLESQLKQREQQYEYYRNKLLTFE